MQQSPEAKDCPSALELRQRIADRLLRDPFANDPTCKTTVFVSFSRADRVYRARLSIRDAEAEVTLSREFEDIAVDCGQLADALVLGVALLLEDETAWEKPFPRPLDSTSTAPARAVTATPQIQSTALPDINRDEGRRPRVETQLLIGPVMCLGVVSSNTMAWGVGVSGAITPHGALGLSWSIEYLKAAAIERGLTRYEFSQTAGFVGPSLVTRPIENLQLAVDASIMVGVLHAAVLNRNPIDPGDTPLVGTRLGGKAQLRLLGPITLGLGSHLRVPFSRTVYRASGLAEPVWSQPRLGFSAEFVAGVTLD